MEKGIVLIAIGSPTYGQWAYNMATSIKRHSPLLPIALIHDDVSLSHLSNLQKDIAFDKFILADQEDYVHEGKFAPGKLKVSLYKYLPFKENIFLDVDGLILKDITPLFVQDTLFKMQVNAFGKASDQSFDKFHWLTPAKMRDHYGLKDEILYAVSSAFMYVKRSKVAEGIFKKALKAFKETPGLTSLREKWGGSYPDELYFTVALAKSEVNPKCQNPLFLAKGRMDVSHLEENFYGLSLIGNNIHQGVISYYDHQVYANLKKTFNEKSYFIGKNMLKHKFTKG